MPLVLKMRATLEPTNPATRIFVMVAGIPNLMHMNNVLPSKKETIQPANNPDTTDPQHDMDASPAAITAVEPCSGARDVAATTEHTEGKA